MKTVAIIPARGGSKRIPRKNIKDFCGQPIIAYSIQAAQKSGLFDRIIVSTDEGEIAEVSKQYGAEIPFIRPKELADDHTGTNAVVKHALEWFRDQGEPAKYACCIYATAPFLAKGDLQKGFQRVQQGGCEFAFSVTSFAFPIQRSIRIDESGGVDPIFPESIVNRSQDLEEAYHDAGQFYWGKPAAFLEAKPLFAPHSRAVIMPRHRVQDIDSPEDWKRAEIMWRVLRETGEV